MLGFLPDELLALHNTFVEGTVVRERALTRCCRDPKVQAVLAAQSEKARLKREYEVRKELQDLHLHLAFVETDTEI